MLRGHGSKMPRLLHAAVEAYLEEGFCGRAARRVGIGRSTFYRWTKEPEFRQLYDQLRRLRAAV
jgi:transposase-like protein